MIRKQEFDVDNWTCDDVFRWAVEVVKIDEKHAQKLKDQEIKGSSLLRMDKLDFERYHIPGGPSADLYSGILQIVEGQKKEKILQYGRDVIQKQKEEHRANEVRYRELAKLCSEFINDPSSFETKFVDFPLLLSKPKQFPATGGKLILQKETVSFFVRLYDAWVKGLNSTDRHGWYFTGPNGVGKSVALYCLVCMARASGFLVVYVPNCDTWCSYGTELESYLWLLQEITSGLIDFLDTPTTTTINKTTWGELLTEAWSSKDDLVNLKKIIGYLMEEIISHTDHPVIFCFDEINALYSNKIWTNDVAYQSPLFRIACNINVTPFKRGFKLLSGTGHEQFFLKADPGTITDYSSHLYLILT
eukprot:TRINITY_DN7765_c0_g2_i2.p2 TRINITY_DN7765_c0_g2~~TRINITY_DN7765_c0_g2_i2.p2  ORF type:complete len:360 (-),score=37.67 TRINITY_DN7765_c0_g2_i2:1152-2231(-)